jgi:hypothetical protein
MFLEKLLSDLAQPEVLLLAGAGLLVLGISTRRFQT